MDQQNQVSPASEENPVASETSSRAPQPSPQVTPLPIGNDDIPPRSKSDSKVGIFFGGIVLFILIGVIVFSYMVLRVLPAHTNAPEKSPVQSKAKEVSLPLDAVQIQACADHKGTLFVKPKDIPYGPIYLVYKGKIIGLEYMLPKEEFLNGKSYKFLTGLGINADHINIGLLSNGHEGFTKPHYHVDVYSVARDYEQSITCPKSVTTTDASSSATPTKVTKQAGEPAASASSDMPSSYH